MTKLPLYIYDSDENKWFLPTMSSGFSIIPEAYDENSFLIWNQEFGFKKTQELKRQAILKLGNIVFNEQAVSYMNVTDFSWSDHYPKIKPWLYSWEYRFYGYNEIDYESKEQIKRLIHYINKEGKTALIAILCDKLKKKGIL